MDSSGCRIETRPLTAEEEALKRNTDCVYFLASPLTCKKGTECEYRHSEGARLNPRDCWYWLNSNCLNPKCAFRHPPLDGLFESSGITSVTVPTPLQTATSNPVPIPIANTPAYGLNKQNALCIYFQKGHCLKGARCPFSHGPHSTASAVLQPAVKPSPTLPHQPQAFTKDQFVNQQSIRQCNTTTQLNISQVSASKSSEAPVSSAKLVTKTESNGVSHSKSLLSHPYINNNKFPKSHSGHTTLTNNNAWSWADRQIHPSDDHLQDGLEPGEIVESSSSRFNALVADSSRNGDEYVRGSSQGERKHEPANGYTNHSTFGRDRYVGSVDESGRIGRTQDYRDTKPHRISSDRRLEIPSLPERRLMQRRKSPDVTDSSDLRNRLKQRRLDYRQEPYERDAGYMEGKQGYPSRSDQIRDLPESSLSTRLRGRISLPGVSPAPNNNEGKQYERRKASEEPPLLPNPRNFGCRTAKREDGDAVNFSGPKSLAELKGAKGVDSSKDQPTKSANNKDREGSPLFEGPKPLSVLLKRKREEESIECANTGSGNDDCQRSKEPPVCGSVCTTAEEQASCVAESNEEENANTVASLGVQVVETAEEDELIYDEHSSEKEEVLGTRDYMEVDEATEEQELQHSDARDGESDSEATETGGFKEEYEIQGGEDDDDDDDDEEDFARKVGLLFS